LAAGSFFRAGVAFACIFDTDCPGTACGGQVCEFPSMTCQAAGSQPGTDGWCGTDSHCKCQSLGATCVTLTHYCTFTKPPMDMAQPHDMTPPLDFAVPPDLTPPLDFAVPPDLTPPRDLAAPPGSDLATLPDLSAPPDLSTPRDLSTPDLSMSMDLSALRDLTSPADLAGMTPMSCDHDTQCPGAACGGQVCQWPAMTCVAAGGTAAGVDGWCNTTDDCKCKAEGAVCNQATFHCTFTESNVSSVDMGSPMPSTDMGSPTASTDLSGALACDHDTQCPSAECGGQVCQWPAQVCVPAGSVAAGSDGWCNRDDECKCQSQGATCDTKTLHCTFTVPKAPTPKSGDCAMAGASTGTPLGAALFVLALFARLRRRRPSASRLVD
jgi:MYXO-CTERM domain-containing protein